MKKLMARLLTVTWGLLMATGFLLTGCGKEEAAEGGIVAIMVCVWVFFAAIWIFLFVVWIIMLIDCIKRKPEEFPGDGENTKTIWLVVVILTGGIGAIVYYFMVKKKMPLKK
jgi:heme/copper-type cytochrome/quinol oxidase subunit 2